MQQLGERDVIKLVQRRIPFRLHISYDENITPFLAALEKMNKKTPLNGLHWSIEDAETISPAQDYSTLAPSLPAILPAWSPVKYFEGYYEAK